MAEQYGKDRPFLVKILLRQASKFKQGGRGIIEYFISKLSITLLVMMPFLALILKLLYFRRDYYYVEHLVFALHFHAFAFNAHFDTRNGRPLLTGRSISLGHSLYLCLSLPSDETSLWPRLG